jgi:hypothetical protein
LQVPKLHNPLDEDDTRLAAMLAIGAFLVSLGVLWAALLVGWAVALYHMAAG